MSDMACRYCEQRGFEQIFRHENTCAENPDHKPNQEYTFACGHRGLRKPFSNDPDGSKIAAFLQERICDDCFLTEYRAAQRNRTPEQIREQRLEARAAHGPGVELVNVITGEHWTT